MCCSMLVNDRWRGIELKSSEASADENSKKKKKKKKKKKEKKKVRIGFYMQL
jgi:hypothetical protein